MNQETAAVPSAGMRKMTVIGPTAFLNSLGIGSVNLGLIFIVKEVFNAPPYVVGWFGALWSFIYFLSCLAFQRLTARLVPRSSMLFMLAVSITVLLVLCAFPKLEVAFAAYAIFGMSISFFWPPMMAWMSRGLEGKNLSRATGLFNFSWSIGGIASPYLAGALSQRGKFLPIYFAILVFVLNAAFLFASRRILRDSDERPSTRPGSHSSALDESTPLRFQAWTSVFALYAAIGVLANIFPLFARSNLRLSEADTGLMITIRSAATTAGFLFFGRFSFWRFRRSLLVLPTMLAAAFGILLALAGSSIPLLAAGLVGMGFAASWSYNNSMFYGASGAPDRDRRMTIHEALLTAGQVMGSLAGGALYQAVSMQFVFLFLTVLALVGTGVEMWMSRNQFGERPLQRPPLPR